MKKIYSKHLNRPNSNNENDGGGLFPEVDQKKKVTTNLLKKSRKRKDFDPFTPKFYQKKPQSQESSRGSYAVGDSTKLPSITKYASNYIPAEDHQEGNNQFEALDNNNNNTNNNNNNNNIQSNDISKNVLESVTNHFVSNNKSNIKMYAKFAHEQRFGIESYMRIQETKNINKRYNNFNNVVIGRENQLKNVSEPPEKLLLPNNTPQQFSNINTSVKYSQVPTIGSPNIFGCDFIPLSRPGSKTQSRPLSRAQRSPNSRKGTPKRLVKYT